MASPLCNCPGLVTKYRRCDNLIVIDLAHDLRETAMPNHSNPAWSSLNKSVIGSDSIRAMLIGDTTRLKRYNSEQKRAQHGTFCCDPVQMRMQTHSCQTNQNSINVLLVSQKHQHMILRTWQTIRMSQHVIFTSMCTILVNIISTCGDNMLFISQHGSRFLTYSILFNSTWLLVTSVWGRN